MKYFLILGFTLVLFKQSTAKSQTLLSHDISPIIGWNSPLTDKSELEEIKQRFQHVIANKSLPTRGLIQELQFFAKNESQILNKNHIVLIDYARPSNQPRMFIINLRTGKHESFLTTHGRNSDVNNDGCADSFSNRLNSLQTSLGFMLTAGEAPSPKFGIKIILDGLSKSSSAANERAVVIHPAPYVSPRLPKLGRSWGCPAVEPRLYRRIASFIKTGTLIYSWYDENLDRSGLCKK